MAALDLEEEQVAPLFPEGFSQRRSAIPDVDRSWGEWAGDIGQRWNMGVAGIRQGVEDVLTHQISREGDPAAEAAARDYHQQRRERWQADEEAAVKKLTPTGRRELEATILPEEGKPTVWDSNVSTTSALVSKVAGAAPSVVASLLATVFGGGAGGIAVASGMSAGEVLSSVRETVENTPTEELAANNPLFAGYLSMGMDERTARDYLLEETTRNEALLMGVFTAATTKFLPGVEGRLPASLASRLSGRAAKGAAQTARRGATALGEAVQEGLEEGASGLLTHTAKEDATGVSSPINWYQLANQVAEGAFVGAGMGAALGGGRRRDAAPAPGAVVGDTDPAVEAAASATINPVTPEVTEPDLVEQLESIPNQIEVPPGVAMPAQGGATAPATPDAVVEVRPGSPVASPIDEDVAAALAPTVTEEGLEDAGEDLTAEDSVVPPIPVGSPVVTPQVAQVIGSAGVGQPLPEAAPAPALAEAPATTPAAEIETPPTANVEPVEAIEETAPTRTGSRVLPSQLTDPMMPVARGEGAVEVDPKKARSGPRMSKKMREQAEAGKEVLPVREAAKRDRADELAGAATKARENIQAIPYNPASLADPKAMREYVRKVAASVGKLSLRNLPEDADDVLKHVLAAKELATKGSIQDPATVEALQNFMINDFTLRKGEAVAEYLRGQSTSWAGIDENVSQEGIETAGSDTASKGAVISEEAEAIERGALEKKAAGAPAPEKPRKIEVLKQKAPEPADTGETVLAGQNRAGKFQVETKKRRGLKPVPKTEAQAETQLAQDIFEENPEVLDPIQQKMVDAGMATHESMVEGNRKAVETVRKTEAFEKALDATTRLRQMEEGIDRLVSEHPKWVDTNGLRRLKTRIRWVRDAIASGDMASVEAKADSRSGLFRRGALGQMYEGQPQQVRDLANQIDELGSQIEDIVYGEAEIQESAQGVLRSLSLEEILENSGDEDLAAALMMAKKRAEEGPPYERKTTLGRFIKENRLPSEVTGANRVLMAQIRDRITKLASDVPVTILSLDLFVARMAPIMEKLGDYRLPSGIYLPETDEIILLDEKVSQKLMLHEGAHAVYEHALMARPEVRNHIWALAEPVRQQFLKEAAAAGKEVTELPYGLTNSSEFIAEAFANPEFQDLLARTPVPQNRRVPYKSQGLTVWSSVLRQLAEILGWRKGFRPETALEQIVKVSEHLDEQIGRERSGRPMLDRPMFGAGPLVNVKKELANYAVDHPLNEDYNFRRIGLVAATFNTIVRNFDELFNGSPLKRIQRAMDDMRQTAQGVADEARGHAENWLKLEHGDYQEARRAAHLVNELTMANMNPVDKAGFGIADLLAANKHLANKRMSSYQARQKLVRLNAEFMALKPSTRQLITSSGNWFRDTQNKLTRENVSKLLDAVKTGLTPQQRADLTTKITRGRLDDADKALIDDPVLFKAMQHASELRVIDGIYFPLMRHGEYIVITKDKVENLHGGKLVEENVIEWRAPNEKAAKQMYQKFADDPKSPDVTSVGMVRYEIPSGKVLSAADAKGVPHEIGFRARLNTKGVNFFESQREARRFIREARESDQFDFVSPNFLRKSDPKRQDELTSPQVRAILDTIGRRDDISDGQKNLLSGVMKEAAIRQMSGNRIQQRSLPRRNIKGASENTARNVVMYGQAAGNYLGRIKHMDAIREAIDDMEEQNKTGNAKNRQAREQVIDEVTKRAYSNAQDELELPRWVQDAYVLSYLYRLFSPAYSIINGMQPWMVTAPVLGGEYGNLRATAALGNAYRTVGALGLTGSGLANTGRAAKGVRQITLDTTDLIKSMRDNITKNAASPAEAQRLLEVIDEAVSRGKIEPNAGQEIAAAAGTGAGGFRKGLASIDRVARQLPQAVEAVNRSVTLVAAYRLHFAASGDHKQSLERAFDMMMSTQGDYSVQNNPRFFKHPLLKPALQFKKYALMMGNLLVDLFRRGLGKNPSREDRKAALKTLGNIGAMQIVMAGTLGLPAIEIIKVGAMVAASVGLGDGWEDLEREWRDLLDQSFGKDWGEALATGLVGKAIGIDLSKRLSLADLAIYGEPKEYNEEGAYAYAARTALGAPGSMVADWFKGLKHARDAAFNDGSWLKAAETMIPVKLAADISKAVGGYNKRDMDLGDAVKQVAGFRSRRLAEEGYQTGVRVAAVRDLTEKAKDLSRRYVNAETKAELMKLRAQIAAHNKEVEQKKAGLKQKVFPTALDRVRASKEAKRTALRGEARAE